MTKEPIQKDRTTDLGIVRINNEAIMTIASIAALEVKGVRKMGGGIGKTLLDTLLGGNSARGVKIQAKDGEVKLGVSIIVEYGSSIPRVADEVQESVKRAVERMTGLALSEVDVIVESVHAQASYSKDRRSL